MTPLSTDPAASGRGARLLFGLLPYPFLAAVLTLFLIVSDSTNVTREWEDVYRRAAQTLLDGGDIYSHGNYLYPPILAYMTVPLVPFPVAIGQFLWLVTNLICLFYVIRGCWWLADGRPLHRAGGASRLLSVLVCLIGLASVARYGLNSLGGHAVASLTGGGRGWIWGAYALLAAIGAAAWWFRNSCVPGHQDRAGAGWALGEHLVFGCGLACGIRFALDCMAHQQTDLCIAALVVVGCWQLRRERPFAAAASFGVAAGMKCTPLIWAPYLIWKRKWGPACTVVLIALAVNLLPAVAIGPRGDVPLARWAIRSLAPMAEATSYPGTWGTHILFNQSLAGTVSRLARTNGAWDGTSFHLTPSPAPLDPLPVKWCLYGACLALVLAAAAVIRRGEDRSGGRLTVGLEYSLVVLLMLLLSPMSGKAHFGLLLLPGFCLARVALQGRNVPLIALLGAAVCLASASCNGWNGLGVWVLWAGGVTWSTTLLLVGCLATLGRYRSLEQPPGPVCDSRPVQNALES